MSARVLPSVGEGSNRNIKDKRGIEDDGEEGKSL